MFRRNNNKHARVLNLLRFSLSLSLSSLLINQTNWFAIRLCCESVRWKVALSSWFVSSSFSWRVSGSSSIVALKLSGTWQFGCENGIISTLKHEREGEANLWILLPHDHWWSELSECATPTTKLSSPDAHFFSIQNVYCIFSTISFPHSFTSRIIKFYFEHRFPPNNARRRRGGGVDVEGEKEANDYTHSVFFFSGEVSEYKEKNVEKRKEREREMWWTEIYSLRPRQVLLLIEGCLCSAQLHRRRRLLILISTTA